MPASSARVERVYPFALEQRSADGPPRIVGHAAVFRSLSEDLGGFREEVKRGAFAKTVSEPAAVSDKPGAKEDVRALFNHDPNHVLGRTVAGTLGLAEDHIGLRVAIEPPPTTWAQDLLISMTPRREGMRADIDQMSFAFQVIKESQKLRQQTAEEQLVTGDSLPVRVIHEVRLYDVSVVTFPAYTATDAAVRSALLKVGIDFDNLAAAVGRHERGITPTLADVGVLRDTLAALSALLPVEPIPVITPVTAEPMPEPVSLERWRQRLLLAEHAV